MASFSSYLSFSAMYEVEQYQKQMAQRAQSGVLRRDSNSSNSSASSISSSSTTTSASSSPSRRVHFLPSSDSDSDLSSSPSSSSVYASHAAKLHSSSKRYSTSDGSLRGSFCPWDLCTGNATCRRCVARQIDDQDLSLKRFGR